MLAGIGTLAVAALGAAYGILVLRAVPYRRDNLMFGKLCLLDATITAWRGFNALAGQSMTDLEITVPCGIGTVGLGLLTLEFMSAFPRQPPMARWLRATLVIWGVASAAAIIVETYLGHAFAITQWTFFPPVTVLVFVCGARAWRRATNRDERMVIAALWLRWAFGFTTHEFGDSLGLHELATWAEILVVSPLSFVLIGTAVLRSELFSVRCSVAEAFSIALIALMVVLGGGAAVWSVQRWIEPGMLQQALLIGATLIPLGLAALGYAMYPRVERRVLAGLDERRARRLEMQGHPLPPDASTAIAEACSRIAAIGDGSAVAWMPARELSPDLTAALGTGEPLRGCDQPALPAMFAVPAIGAGGALVGAFYLEGGLIDRDTYLVARDLAARVALTVERADAVSALDDARRLAALGQFAAAIAHDIRTPLTSISLNVQILRRKLQLPADDREHLDIALEELARLDASVAEILDFAKPVRLAAEPIDVGELLETAARGLSPVLSEKGVALRCEPAPLIIHGDRLRLRQVLANLVGNAADASKPGAHVTLRASTADARHVAIEIEDHGRGICADDLARIFEPFFTTRPDGTGLGLAICHKVVRAHGGDIKVRSTLGQGSIFTVLLPAALAGGAALHE